MEQMMSAGDEQGVFHGWNGFEDFLIASEGVGGGIAKVATTWPAAIFARWFSCSGADGWGPISERYRDLTPCFLQGVLMGILHGFVIIGGLYQLDKLRKKRVAISTRISWPFYVKLGLVLLQLVYLVVLLFCCKDGDIVRDALGLSVVANIVAMGLHYLEHFKSHISSGVLLFYWLGLALLGFARILNLNLRGNKNPRFSAISILSFANSVLILVAEMYFPPRPFESLDKQLKSSPFDRANVFSRLTFSWMLPLMKKGYYQFLTEEDLPTLPREFRASDSTETFLANWNRQTGRHSLTWAIFKSFGKSFVFGGFCKLIQDILAFVQPQLLRSLIKFVNEYSQSSDEGTPLPLTRGYMIALSMFLVAVIQTFFLHQYFRTVADFGMKIKTALTSAIYKKSLALSNEARQESSTGDIVNLMSVDVQRLHDLVQNLQIIWSGPFQIVICLVSLHSLLGKSMWAGVAILIFMIPLNAAIARYQRKLQRVQMTFKDERSRLINDILSNIKSLKLYGWEVPFLKKLNVVRNDKELRNLKKMGVFSALTNFAWTCAPFLVSCSTFAVFTIIEKKRVLLTDIVFPALALFNLLSFPLAVFPQVITNIVEAQVAVSRLVKFLTSSELQQDATIRTKRVSKMGEVALSIKNGTYLWSKKKSEGNYQIALSKINFEAKKGTLNCIVGKVGSGKSSIIQAVLGDLYKLEGISILHGKVAYVSQVSWIMNGTVRENILFGLKYDPEFYQHVIKACALNIDLKVLPKGDKTEVGEKGISLSGGQKARLSLARAVYARADVYLLDDPLSAVDEHVGRHLIDHVLGPNGLLRSKCRVLATNKIGVLSIADSLHMVSDGKLVEQGTYDDIMKQESSLIRQLIKDFGKGKEESTKEIKEEDGLGYTDLESSTDMDVDSLRRPSDASLNSDEEDIDDEVHKDEVDSERKEHQELGKVKWDVYKEYARACNPSSVLIYLTSTIVSMLVSVFASVWLKHWSEVNTRKGGNPNIPWYLGIYFLLGFGSAALVLLQNVFLWILCSINGSKKLHNNMATCVLRAPMSFFETTPIGRILNRFSNDVYKIDEILGRVFGMCVGASTKVLFSLGVICFSTWQTLFLIVPLGALYVYYQQYYMRTSRELRRLDSITRSPIFAHFQESLSGVSIIRAYGKDERFKSINESIVDRNMSAFHPSINANRWLAVRLEFIGSVIILSAAGFAIFSLKNGAISAGLVGLSMSYALQITQSLNWIVRMTVEVETNIVAVERVLEYSELESEAPRIIEHNRPKASWPEAGKINFNNYSTRYRPGLDLVLKDINLEIQPREKVGIVGRTGAGKSSLTLALFRIIESAKGDIVIDDIVTSSIGLSDLRHHLSIIPQDSQVFEGTVRTNLDPTETSSDEQLWKALELSHLKSHIMKMVEYSDSEDQVESGLDVKITEGGSNLSVGQRQLICLARALLVPSRILVLDEATAAIDVETDGVIQDTIRNEFKDRTILTIAHRINTIMDSDKIIVLDCGKVVEFDKPLELLKNKDSLFYGLCKESGLIE